MEIVVDTSAIIAVLTGERHHEKIVQATKNAILFAPHSLHWEVGNAFSAMFKKKAIALETAKQALALYPRIPIRKMVVSLEAALDMAERMGIYAYDAYVLLCVQKRRCPLLTLDGGQRRVARDMGLEVLEI